MLEEKTKLFVLENEAPSALNPDVRPYRCKYCGLLAIVERVEMEAGFHAPVAVYHDCVDANLEVSLTAEIAVLGNNLSEKQNALINHVETMTFDDDTTVMRYEDAVKTLKIQFGIVDEPVA